MTLVEVRRRLGGAAYSFERDGMCFDNGQHVFLRCCVAYRALLARLGSEHHTVLQPPACEIPVLKPGSPTAVLRRGGLPVPLHLAGALARYRHLTVARACRCGARGARAGATRSRAIRRSNERRSANGSAVTVRAPRPCAVCGT